MTDFYPKAIELMNQVGFYPTSLTFDGRIHSFKTNPSDKKKKGWYVGFQKGERLYLVFNDWRKGGDPYRFTIYRDDSIGPRGEQFSENNRELDRLQLAAERQTKIRQDTAAIEAEKIWQQSKRTNLHVYTFKKGIAISEPDFGVGVYQNKLIVPVRSVNGKICGLQRIGAGGDKFFLPGTKKKGCFHTIGDPEASKILVFVEGFATGASLALITGFAIIVAFDAGNLKPVAEILRNRYPNKPFLFAADADLTGVEKAKNAAECVDGVNLMVQPTFREPKTGTDFNDLMKLIGPEAIRDEFLSMLPELFGGVS